MNYYVIIIFIIHLMIKCPSFGFIIKHGMKCTSVGDLRHQSDLNLYKSHKNPRYNSCIYSSSSEVIDEVEDRKRKIRILRSSTGRGTQECYDALKEAEGDIHKASQILMKAVVDSGNSKGGTGSEIVDLLEGRIALTNDLNLGAMIDIRCETDYVAKNKMFLNLSKSLVNGVHKLKSEWISSNTNGTINEFINVLLDKKCIKCNRTLKESGVFVSSALKERISVARIGFMTCNNNELLISYIHSSNDPKGSLSFSGLSSSIIKLKLSINGESGVISGDKLFEISNEDIELTNDNCCISGNGCIFTNELKVTNIDIDTNDDFINKFKKFIKQLTMHIVAEKPIAMTFDSYDKEGIESMRKQFEESLKGKPKDIIQKIVNGKLRKQFGQYVLMEQVC